FSGGTRLFPPARFVDASARLLVRIAIPLNGQHSWLLVTGRRDIADGYRILVLGWNCIFVETVLCPRDGPVRCAAVRPARQAPRLDFGRSIVGLPRLDCDVRDRSEGWSHASWRKRSPRGIRVIGTGHRRRRMAHRSS